MLVPTLFISLFSLVAANQQLAKRQVSVGIPSSMPSQCTSTCTPINNEVSLGCPLTACCTTTFETEYYNCLVCVGAVLDAANYTVAQNSLNLLYMTCVDMGFVLPRLELPGQGDNATSTSTQIPAGSGSGASAIGAAVGEKWPGVRVEVLIGAAVLLGVTGLW